MNLVTRNPLRRYFTKECLCEDQGDCQPAESQYYTVTRNALDRVMMAFDDSIDNIVKQTGVDPTLQGATHSTQLPSIIWEGSGISARLWLRPAQGGVLCVAGHEAMLSWAQRAAHNTLRGSRCAV